MWAIILIIRYEINKRSFVRKKLNLSSDNAAGNVSGVS